SPLEQALADDVTRACAAQRLRHMGAFDSLLHAAQRGAPAVRATALYHLGLMKNPAALDALVAAAKDADPLVGAGGIHALLQFDDPRVLPTLLDIASRQGVSSLAAVNSLAGFHDPSVLPVLYTLLGARDPLLRVAAIGALGEVGDAASVTKLQPLLRQQADLRATPGIGIGLFPAVNMARAARVAIDKIQSREALHAAR
ncbi:MAG TPA: HEAT repeat domain-containing protein, partial [Bryobacterales bacterium]|nr:HEAT repeat domain-containing protein [Bryobacterales bacterium]